MKYLYVFLMCIVTTICNAEEFTIYTQESTNGHYVNAAIMAKYWKKYLPNHPDVVVKSIPGAAGIIEANYVYNIAKKDGSEIGTIDTRVFTQGLAKSDTVKYDLTNFGWLGSVVDGRDQPIIVWHRMGQEDLILGLTSSLNTAPLGLIQKISGKKITIVNGYATDNDTKMAFENNEINMVIYNIVGIKTTKPNWLTDNTIQPLYQYGNGCKRSKEFLNVATICEKITSNDDFELLSHYELQTTLLRSFATPPQIPNKKLKELRNTFISIVTDEDYIKEAEKINLHINPINWSEVESVINSMITTRGYNE